VSKKMLKITMNCPYCKESVELILSKNQIKKFYKSFKLPLREANLRAEAYVKN